jgi:hypothetical protein
MVPREVRSVSARYLLFFLIAVTLLSALQGCTAAAVPAVAYGVSQIATPKAQPAQPAPSAPVQRTYPEYLTEMERINMEREKAGLSPRPIMTQEEWVSAQGAGRTHPAPSTSPQPAPAMSVPAQSAPTPAAPAPAASAPPVPAAETPDKNSEAK